MNILAHDHGAACVCDADGTPWPLRQMHTTPMSGRLGPGVSCAQLHPSPRNGRHLPIHQSWTYNGPDQRDLGGFSE
jgi:hypothetical protein